MLIDGTRSAQQSHPAIGVRPDTVHRNGQPVLSGNHNVTAFAVVGTHAGIPAQGMNQHTLESEATNAGHRFEVQRTGDRHRIRVL